MADDFGGAFALERRRGLGIEQEQGLAEEHRPRIFHGPGFEIGDRDQVEFFVGVGQREVTLETRQGLAGGFRGKTRQVALARDMPDADRGLAQAFRARGLERADGECQQIGRERWGGPEVVNHTTGVVRIPALPRDRSVREDLVICPRGDVQGKARLHGGLVEAGEEAPRVRRLELGEGVAVPTGFDTVEAAQILAQRPVEAQP